MRLDIVLDFGHHNIMIWHKCCLSLVRLHYSKVMKTIIFRV